MSNFRRYEIIERTPSSFFKESSLLAPKTISFNPFCPSTSSLFEDHVDFALDFLCPALPTYSFHRDVDTITDLIQIEKDPFYTTTTTRRIKKHHPRRGLGSELCLHGLCDRVSALELGIHHLVGVDSPRIGERKYTWTAEFKTLEKDGLDRKYKWRAEVKDGKKKGAPLDRNYKFTAELKGRGDNSPIKRSYKFEASSSNAGSGSSEEKDKKKKQNSRATRHVGIADSSPDHGAVVLRQALPRRMATIRGKKKEVSPQDAASFIQMSFRAYLIRRSQALRGLRELAIARTKLKEIRALFNNFAYRGRVARDAEERQRFSEKIVVLLLTTDAIEGTDLMVRAAKRSMVNELEAMLDVIDPQPSGRSLSMRRRTFDMPDAVVQKELAAGVAQVVRLLDQEASASEAIEACL